MAVYIYKESISPRPGIIQRPPDKTCFICHALFRGWLKWGFSSSSSSSDELDTSTDEKEKGRNKGQFSMRFSFVFLLGGGGGVGGEKKKKVTELYSEESTAVPSAKGLEAIHLAVDDRSTPAHFSLSLLRLGPFWPGSMRCHQTWCWWLVVHTLQNTRRGRSWKWLEKIKMKEKLGLF